MQRLAASSWLEVLSRSVFHPVRSSQPDTAA